MYVDAEDNEKPVGWKHFRKAHLKILRIVDTTILKIT